MNTATQIAEMLWEYCRESGRLRQAVLAARARAQCFDADAAQNARQGIGRVKTKDIEKIKEDCIAEIKKEWAQPAPSPARRIKLGGRFKLHLHLLAEYCPSWPDKPAEQCPDEVAKLALGFFPKCARIEPTVTVDGKSPSGHKLARKDWHYAERLPSDQAELLPVDVVKVDWRLSDAVIAEHIAKLRPATFKDSARARKGTPSIFGARLPATPEAACRALEVLRQFINCGNRWPDYFKKHPHNSGQTREVARTGALRECNTARRMLVFLEAESIPGATK